MKTVEILHFDGCPNVERTRDRVRAVAARLGVEIDLRDIRIGSVEDAVQRRFVGSPSVRVDGVDIDPEARSCVDFGLSCRVYGAASIPSEAMIATALAGPTAGRPRKHTGLVSGSAVVAAAFSSACCWLPLVLLATGISLGGISAVFEVLRPWFIGVAVALLALGVWLTERRRSEEACGCEPVPRRRRAWNRFMLGLSALGVAAFTFFPQYVNAVFGERSALVSTSASREVKLRVVGMTCTGCETGIETALRRLPGVAFADASYDDRTVVVHLAPGATLDAEALVKTIATAGYEARPIETGHPTEPAREQSLRVLQHDLAPLAERFNTVAGRTQFLAILSPT